MMYDPYASEVGGVGSIISPHGRPRGLLPPKPSREPSPAEVMLGQAVHSKITELLAEGISARTLRRIVDFCQATSAALLPFEGTDALIEARLGPGGSYGGPYPGSTEENYGTKVIHEIVAGMKDVQKMKNTAAPEEKLADLLEAHKMATSEGLTDIAEKIMVQIRSRMVPSVDGVPMLDEPPPHDGPVPQTPAVEAPSSPQITEI